MLQKKNNHRNWIGILFAQAFTTGFLVILTIIFTVNSLQCASHQKSSVKNHPNPDRSSFLKNLHSNYASHKKLFVKFDLKGKYNSKDFYYTGTIYGTMEDKILNSKTTVKIKIQDAVFLSLLYTIDISSKFVTIKNHVTGERQTIDTHNFNIVEIFGSGFPFHFLLPMMLGKLPHELFSPKARVNIDEQNIKYSNREYEIIAKFSDSRIKDIYYREKKTSIISVFVFRGKLKKPMNTPYPRTIFISNNKTRDNVTLIFKKVIVKRHL